MRPVLTSVVAFAVSLAVAGVGGAASTSKGVYVTINDYRFTLSKKTVAPGRFLFLVTNKGPSAHTFKIAGKQTKKLYAYGNQKGDGFAVNLASGRYTYLCTVPGHAKKGMKGVLVVKAAATSGGSGSNNGGPTG